jgi:hypothetical protein
MCVESPFGTTILIMHQTHSSEFSFGPEEIIAPPKRSRKGKRTGFTNLIRGGTSGSAAGSSGPSTHTDSGIATSSNPPPAPPVTPPPPPLPSTVGNTGAAPAAPVEPEDTAAAPSEPSGAPEPGPPSTGNTFGSLTIGDLFQQISDLRRDLNAKHSPKKALPEAVFFKSVPQPKPRSHNRQVLLVSSQIAYVNLAVSYKPLGIDAQGCAQAIGYQV